MRRVLLLIPLAALLILDLSQNCSAGCRHRRRCCCEPTNCCTPEAASAGCTAPATAAPAEAKDVPPPPPPATTPTPPPVPSTSKSPSDLIIPKPAPPVDKTSKPGEKTAAPVTPPPPPPAKTAPPADKPPAPKDDSKPKDATPPKTSASATPATPPPPKDGPAAATAPPPPKPATPAKSNSKDDTTKANPSSSSLVEPKDAHWTSLFDGKTLGSWKSTEFGTEGKVEVKNGELVLGFGDGCTGVTWKDAFPKLNYEISLQAKRVDGTDFFCGLTFPVGESPCTFIVGGWGGGVVGLSSIDGEDASENDTTKYMAFTKDQWYSITVRVTKDHIGCWIDKQQMVDQPLAGRKLSIRSEVELSKPLGIASWKTIAALRDIKWRTLADSER